MTIPLAERFYQKVDKNGPLHPDLRSRCWVWTGCRSRHGYGRISVERKPRGAHRVSYELHVEPIPHGLHVMHKCDNPCCVNPSHLTVGTQQDNVRDMVQKGRRVANTRLTEEQVRDIYNRAHSGPRGICTQLAQEYGLSLAQVSHIKRGRRWPHVTQVAA